MGKPTRTPIRNIVCISDTHFGCTLGLCPPSGCKRDGTGTYIPTFPAAAVLWNWWEEFWGEFVPRATHREPFVAVHNGDVIDGDHHKSTTQISHNIKDQRELAIKVLRPKIAKAEAYYSIRGTPAHVGESSVEEEEVAQRLDATPNSEGQYSRFDLWLQLGNHLGHFLHHIGTTSSSAHEASAVNAELTAEFVEAARWAEKAPSFIVRSHRHRSIEVRIPIKGGYATAVVTPAWQLKTPFCFKIAGARLAPPQIGGTVIRLDDTGDICYTIPFVRHIGRDKVEVCETKSK